MSGELVLPNFELCEHVGRWHAIHPAFVGEIIRFFLPECRQDIATLQELLQAYPERAVQLEYAFSTNVRGKMLREKLVASGVADRHPVGKSYLDIGCAYGGFLKSFAEIGYTVQGVEFDQGLAQLCRAHMAAAGVEAEITQADFLSDAVAETAVFDLVTCNDVIEHVSDPADCLRKIYALLRPGGAAYIETVNRLSLPNVTSDIHFQLFGLNLLDHHRASALHRQLTGWHTYGVSEFYELDWYLNTAKRFPGAVVNVIHGDPSHDYRADLHAAFSRFRSWRETEAAGLDPFLVESVEAEFLAYMSDYFVQLRAAHRVAGLQEFHRRYSDPLIRFSLHKPPALAAQEQPR